MSHILSDKVQGFHGAEDFELMIFQITTPCTVVGG